MGPQLPRAGDLARVQEVQASCRQELWQEASAPVSDAHFGGRGADPSVTTSHPVTRWTDRSSA